MSDVLSQALQQAVQLFQAGQLDRAAQLYRQVLARSPEHPEALHWLGAIAYQKQDYDTALDLVGKAVGQQPDNPTYLNTAGMLCRQLGLYEQSLQHLNRARQFRPDSQEVRDNLTALVRQWVERRDDDAQRHFQADDPVAAAEVDLGSGDLWRQAGQDALAERYYCRVLAVRPPLAGIAPKPEPEPDPNDPANSLPPWLQPARWSTTVELGREVDRLSAVNAAPFGQAWVRLAELEQNRGNPDAAIAACKTAARLLPRDPDLYKLLGKALAARGEAQLAANAYAAALRLKPDHAGALSNLGSLFLEKRQLQEALDCYQRAIAADPNLAGAHWNLGNVLEAGGKLPEAIAAWEKALTLDPNLQDASGYYKIATRYLALNKRQEAAHWYQRTIGRDPQFPYSYWDLCETLNFASALGPARDWANRFCAAMTTPTNRIMAAVMHIKTFCNSGDSDRAREKFAALEPELYARLDELSDHDATKLYVNALFDVPHIRDDVAANNQLANLLARKYAENLDRQWAAQWQAAQNNAAQNGATQNGATQNGVAQNGTPQNGTPQNRSAQNNATPAQLAAPADGSRAPYDGQRPLRIGFLSKHYRRHSVGWCSGEILTALKQHTPHLFLYVTGDLTADDRTRVFERVAERFYWPGKQPDYPNTSSAAIVKRVEADDLDVLVDLDSITVLQHADVLYRRPAPVCLTWLGYDAPHICPHNYNLVDWHTHPAGVEHYYVEKLVRMSGSFAAISHLPISRTDRALQRRGQRVDDDQVAFLCVATGQKMSREMLQAQVHILRHVPNSVLFYKGRVGDLQLIWELYCAECDRQGVARNRIKFLPRTSSEENHRTVYLMTDVLLDSYPYSGATHNLEALYFDLPVVTRVGEQSFSRLGYSLMRAAGVETGATWSWEEYIEAGIRFGRDRELRESVRATLRQGKEPGRRQLLWDPEQFAAEMYGILKNLRGKADFGARSPGVSPGASPGIAAATAPLRV